MKLFQPYLSRIKEILDSKREKLVEDQPISEAIVLHSALEKKQSILKSELDTELISEETFLKSYVETEIHKKELESTIIDLEKAMTTGSTPGKETLENKKDFNHHRMMAGYHEVQRRKALEEGIDYHSSSEDEMVNQARSKEKEASRHEKLVKTHLEKAKSLHKEDEHGEWNKTIPTVSAATKYGSKHAKGLESAQESEEVVKEDKEEKKSKKELKKSEEVFDSIKSFLGEGLDDLIEKSGEGSRGGKIIGHTKSGKPIYAIKEHDTNHKDFTPADHRDAAKEHQQQYGKHLKNAEERGVLDEDYKQHIRTAHKHSELSEWHETQAQGKEKDITNKDEKINKAESTVIPSKKKMYADCLIYNSEGKLLLLRRNQTDSFEPGKWCLPGGKIETGEKMTDACLREVLEETNIKFGKKDISLRAVKETDEVCIYYYTGYIKEGEKQAELIILDNDEHINFGFFDKEERSKLPLLLDLIDTLDSLEDYSNEDSITVPKLDKDNQATSTKRIKKEYLS